jgi:hypothetical protein
MGEQKNAWRLLLKDRYPLLKNARLFDDRKDLSTFSGLHADVISHLMRGGRTLTSDSISKLRGAIANKYQETMPDFANQMMSELDVASWAPISRPKPNRKITPAMREAARESLQRAGMPEGMPEKIAGSRKVALAVQSRQQTNPVLQEAQIDQQLLDQWFTEISKRSDPEISAALAILAK